ncbi:flagellar biosynthesis/type III secretory pathway protein FliH [Pseudoduganella flava]|uniref:Flagellar biosynthesis/type III secretory pathway protein n=1 Tax=Pseudoduganella flava TaxID=871742 RepID=A0A562PDH2_9BURK|nr:HrpE/YscL family type III secretion apparatus protein [Pseudoduganella flava]QGZ42145.1 flagellar biosynthesis/type III secretory pathway protein [Pseudoduganella flava]TWI42481.1 flagellar biosynthesis/type III secretory pathway protein FliH [Pseudoduganella flava]
MSAFCVARIALDPALLPEHGVLRAADLRHTADAQALAERIVADAHRERDALLAAARDEAARLAEAAQAQVLRDADALLAGLRTALERLYDGAEDIVAGLAGTLFERLVLETPPAERVAASYRRVLREAPPKLANAVLRLHPDDVVLAGGWQWPVQPDPDLATGACRLEADSGQWHADFTAAAAALAQAFTLAVTNPPAAGEPESSAGH